MVYLVLKHNPDNKMGWVTCSLQGLPIRSEIRLYVYGATLKSLCDHMWQNP
jgi:hypothetical protein